MGSVFLFSTPLVGPFSRLPPAVPAHPISARRRSAPRGLCLCGSGHAAKPMGARRGRPSLPSAAACAAPCPPVASIRAPRAPRTASGRPQPARTSHSCGGLANGRRRQRGRAFTTPPPPQRELPCHTVIWCCRGRSRPFTSDARSGCQSRGRIPAPGRRRTTQRQALAGRYTSLHASGSMVGRPAPSIAHAAERGGNSQRGGVASKPSNQGRTVGGRWKHATSHRTPSPLAGSAQSRRRLRHGAPVFCREPVTKLRKVGGV